MPVARRVRRDRGGGGRVRGVRVGDLPAPVREWGFARTGVDTGGELGAPLVAHCQTTWHRDAAYYSVPWRGRWATEGGGPTMGHGIHQYDLLLHLLGEWEEVQAMAARLVHDTESEDVSTALARFAGGALATVVNSVLSPDEVSRVRVDCADATVEVTHLYGHRNGDWVYTPAPHAAEERAVAWREVGRTCPVRTPRSWGSCWTRGTPGCGRRGAGARRGTRWSSLRRCTRPRSRAGCPSWGDRAGDAFYEAMHGVRGTWRGSGRE